MTQDEIDKALTIWINNYIDKQFDEGDVLLLKVGWNACAEFMQKEYELRRCDNCKEKGINCFYCDIIDRDVAEDFYCNFWERKV